MGGPKDSVIADSILQSFNELTLMVRGRPIDKISQYVSTVEYFL